MPISDGLISARQLCTNSVDTRHISPDAITPTEVASGFNFVELVTTLPVSGNFEGRMVYLTTDDKLYRHDGAAFLLAVDGADITAATISGDRMIANTITAGQIAAATITATELNVASLSAITATMGTLNITSTLTFTSGGVFRTAASGQRIEITTADNDRISFYTGDSFEAISGDIVSEVSGAGGTRTLQVNIRAPATTGDTGAAFLVTRSESFDDSTTPPGVVVGYDGGSTQTPRLSLQNSVELFLETGSVIVSDELGSATAPVLGIGTNFDDGIYSPADSELAVVTAGVLRARFTNTQLRVLFGTAGAPSFAFDGDTDTGMYRGAANQINWATAGGLAGLVNATQDWEFGSGGTGKARISDTAASTTFLTYGFVGDTNTGMHRIGSDQIGFVTGGVLRFAVVNSEVQARGDNGVHFFDYAPAAAGTIDAQWFNAGGNVRRLDVVSSRLSGKQDVVALADFLDTAAVLDLDLIAFRMKDDPDGPIQIGTTAISVGKHLPAMAYKRGREWDFGQYSRLVIPLIAEVRKLRDRVDILEAA